MSGFFTDISDSCEFQKTNKPAFLHHLSCLMDTCHNVTQDLLSQFVLPAHLSYHILVNYIVFI